MEVAVVILVAVNSLIVLWLLVDRRGRRQPGSAPPVQLVAAGTSAVEGSSDLGGQPSARDIVPVGSLSDELGTTLVSRAAPTTQVQLLGVLSKTSSHALVAAPALRQLSSGDLYRMVHKPAGEFIAGPGGTFKGTARLGGRWSGHADWKAVSTRSARAASAVGGLATIAAGAYWQQQIDQKLGRLQQGVDAVASRLNTTLEAELALAHDALNLDEVTAMDGPYRPSAAVTDGLRAARIDLMELQDHFAERVEPQDDLTHAQYVERILTTAQGEHIAHKLHRAVAGVVLEMRVLRLKWSHSYGQPPSYLENLHDELDQLLARVDRLVTIGRQVRALESDHPAEWRRILQSRRRRRRAAADARQGRRDVGEAIGVLSARLDEVRQLHGSGHDDEVQFLVGHDGERLLVMAELPADS